MAKALSTIAGNMSTRAAAVATAAQGSTTTGEMATTAEILKVLASRQDLMHQVLRLIPLATNSGANAVKPE